MLTSFFDTYATRYQPYKNGAWCYEDGCLYRGLELLYRATGEQRWLDHLLRLVTPQITPPDGEGPFLAGYDPSDYNIDNILSGRALLFLDEVTGEPVYLDTAALLMDQLATHPRTRSGVYWHKLRYPWQIWLDGLYMAAPFQIGYGQRTGSDALVEDSLTQLQIALKQAYVPETGLYAHATDEARKQSWATLETGHSRAHWARAIGWLAMCLVDVAELVGSAQFVPLRSQTEALLRRLMELRRPSGLWLQVIDQPDLPGNFEETSASAMFVYALTKGRELGLVEPTPVPLFENLAAACVKPDTNGDPEMIDICEVAGLGPYQGRFRDGTAAYYISEPRVANDIKGVGPLMMAAACHLSEAESKAVPQDRLATASGQA